MAGVGARRGVRRGPAPWQRCEAPLPAELDADALVAVGVQRLALSGHHDRRLQPWRKGARLGQRRKAAGSWRRGEPVGIAAFGQFSPRQDVGHIGPQVVARFVHDLCHDVTGGVRCIERIEVIKEAIQAVPAQDEVHTRGHLAHRPLPARQICAEVQRGHAAGGTRRRHGTVAALRVVDPAIGVASLTAAVVSLQQWHVTGVEAGTAGGGDACQAPPIPCGQGDGVGDDALPHVPGRDRVHRQRRTARPHVWPAEAQGAQAGPRRGVVGHDQGVARRPGPAQIAACLAFVHHPPGPALFGHQAAGKGPVGFAVLRTNGADRARGGHVKAHMGLRPRPKHIRQHILRGAVLKNARVAAVREPVRPGGEGEAVARQAPVCAELRGPHHVAVPVAPAAIGQLEPHRHLLADQRLERQKGAGAEGIDLGPQRLGVVHGFTQTQMFDDQCARRQAGGQLKKACSLPQPQGCLQTRHHVGAQLTPRPRCIGHGSGHARARHQSGHGRDVHEEPYLIVLMCCAGLSGPRPSTQAWVRPHSRGQFASRC
jgi:hypothetical protein